MLADGGRDLTEGHLKCLSPDTGSRCATSTYSSSSINAAAGIAISCRGLEPFASGIR